MAMLKALGGPFRRAPSAHRRYRRGQRSLAFLATSNVARGRLVAVPVDWYAAGDWTPSPPACAAGAAPCHASEGLSAMSVQGAAVRQLGLA